MECTVIGQDVNYAQRIEGLTKQLPCDIPVGESTYREVRDLVVADEFGLVPIRGAGAEMRIYGVKGLN